MFAFHAKLIGDCTLGTLVLEQAAADGVVYCHDQAPGGMFCGAFCEFWMGRHGKNVIYGMFFCLFFLCKLRLFKM